MKTANLLVAFTVLSLTVGAQIENTIDNSIYRAERINNTVGKLKGFLAKKKKDEPKKDTVKSETLLAGTNTTVLIVAGIDFPKLKTLNENIKACSGVKATDMKYGDPSSIEITHSGTTEALMKLVGDVSKDIYAEKNITGFEEGKVSVKI